MSWCATYRSGYVRLMGANAHLQRRMDELRLTQDELARQMNDALEKITGKPGDVSARTVHNLVSGKTKRPIGRTRAALEKVFGCPVEDLGFGSPRPAVPQEDPVRRRTFMTSAAGTAAAAIAPYPTAPKRVGQSDVSKLESKFAAIIAQDHH
jgi:transcriptional regulator with XRE-family HTH domain